MVRGMVLGGNFPQVSVEVGWNIMVKGESLDVL